MVDKKKTRKVVSKSKVENDIKDLEKHNLDDFSNQQNETTHKKVIYVRRKTYYAKRLCFWLLIFTISYISCIYFINKSFDYKDATTVKYQDKQDIDYKVYLKKNDFYESDYLDEDMLYVSSLIKNIDINFIYDFLIEKPISLDFDYKIMGNLVITSPNGNKNYFNKKYVLLDSKKASINNAYKYEIKENIKIDYDYYNNLASSFKTQYAVDTESYLNVYLEIDKKSKEDSQLEINDKSIASINIPLSQRSLEIKFDVPDTSDTKNVIINGELIFNNKIIILEVVIILIAIFSLVKIVKIIIKIKPKKTKYEKFIKKILKEYDRLIVETTTLFDENANIIKINKFEELLDVRDNLKLPVMHYNIENGKRSYFYIKDNNDIYLFDLKAENLENEK